MAVESVISGIWRAGQIPRWVPEFGTTGTGRTVVVFLLVASFGSYVAVPVLAFGLGYRSGKETA